MIVEEDNRKGLGTYFNCDYIILKGGISRKLAAKPPILAQACPERAIYE